MAFDSNAQRKQVETLECLASCLVRNIDFAISTSLLSVSVLWAAIMQVVKAIKRVCASVLVLKHAAVRPSPLEVGSPKASPTAGFTPAVLVPAEVTKAWQQRRLSNFDYLMLLNTLAGRSINDISQYPVMPWVLSTYQPDPQVGCVYV